MSSSHDDGRRGARIFSAAFAFAMDAAFASDGFKMEIGRYEGVRIIESKAPLPPPPIFLKNTQRQHGPERKGRKGKVRRW